MTEGAKQRFTLATMRFILRMQRFIAKYFMQSKALHFIISPPTHVRALHQTPHPSMRQTKHPTQVRGEFRPLHPCMRLSKKQATKIFRRLLNLLFTFILYTNNAMTSNCLHFSNHPLHPYSYRLFYFPNLFDWKFYATRLYL